MTELTKPQQQLLARVEAEGVVRVNGRARSMVKALADRNLVDVDVDWVALDRGQREIYILTALRPTPRTIVNLGTRCVQADLDAAGIDELCACRTCSDLSLDFVGCACDDCYPDR